MCDTCGCGNSEGYRILRPGNEHEHKHLHGNEHDHDDHHHHDHDHEHEHPHSHEHMHDHDDLGMHSHSHSHSHNHSEEGSHDHIHREVVNLNVDILAGNNLKASLNRRFLEGRKVLCLNLVSSPGSGKTTVLEKTISHFVPGRKVYVIEGDQQTLLDASRIEKAGAPAVQVNTGSGCHLDAHMIESAMKELDIETGSVLFIENVGNLVCPAMFDLGETRRVIVVSITEGEDKPLKYPYMFETSHLCLINKSDLLPYLDFDIEELIKNARGINPGLKFISLSARSGEGMDKWFSWLEDQISDIG
jgi:hydrogenase nickel incorporation protein HypB